MLELAQVVVGRRQSLLDRRADVAAPAARALLGAAAQGVDGARDVVDRALGPAAAKATPPKAKSSEKVKSGRAPTSGGSRSAAKAKPPARSSAAKAGSARRAKPGGGTKRGR
ncbi:MAG: hypothetical protein ACR2LH_02775 [Thermoleophilaceae bacterium]